MTLPEETRFFLETQISTAMTQMKIPGLALAMIKEGRIVYERGFGTKDFFKNYPKKQTVTPNTGFEIGSISKSFAALAVMQLHDQGKLDVNDPVSRHLPWFTLGFSDYPIKIHHLLSHSSGMPDLGSASFCFFPHRLHVGYADELERLMVPYSSSDDMKLHFNAAQSEILYKPGEKYFYSNDGYVLLGLIITAVSGENYADYIRKHIFEPLEMATSFFPSEDVDTSGFDVTKHYTNIDGKIIEVPHSVDQIHDPAGGIISSVHEMANYLNLLMSDGAYKRRRIVSKESLTKLISPHQLCDAITGPQYFAGKRRHYGYGWGIHDDFFGHRLVEHSGGTVGACAHVFMIPELHIAVAAFSNIGSGPTHAYLQALIVLMGKDPAEMHPPDPMAELQPLLGKYESYKGISKLEIATRGEGVLYAEESLLGKMVLLPDVSDDSGLKWLVNDPRGIQMRIIFKKDEKNKIHAIVDTVVFHKID